jgi:hypothetical protein
VIENFKPKPYTNAQAALPSVCFIAKFLPNVDLENMISIYRKDSSWEKIAQIYYIYIFFVQIVIFS